MMQLSWTRSAQRELEEVAEYLAAERQRAAIRFVQQVFKGLGAPASFPEIGRMIPEWNRKNYRELIVGRHRLIYRITPSTVTIIKIIHGARILPDLKE